MPVTDLFEEYRNDLRWVKTFYLPLRITSLDYFFTVAINDSAKEAFKEEEGRLFNIIQEKNKKKTPLTSEEISNLPKFDFSSYVFSLSADFCILPDKTKIFKERIFKFFELMKSWTKTDFINIDMDHLEKYINNPEIHKTVLSKITKEFKQAIKFKKSSEDRIKSLKSNLGFFKEKHLQASPAKIVFVTNEDSLDDDIEILDLLLKFVVSCGIPKLYKADQDNLNQFIDKEFISNIVNKVTTNWTKIRLFHESLNKGIFPGEWLGIGDQTEFYNLHKLLPLVYGPTSLNFSYFSNISVRKSNH